MFPPKKTGHSPIRRAVPSDSAALSFDEEWARGTIAETCRAGESLSVAGSRHRRFVTDSFDWITEVQKTFSKPIILV